MKTNWTGIMSDPPMTDLGKLELAALQEAYQREIKGLFDMLVENLMMTGGEDHALNRFNEGRELARKAWGLIQ